MHCSQAAAACRNQVFYHNDRFAGLNPAFDLVFHTVRLLFGPDLNHGNAKFLGDQSSLGYTTRSNPGNVFHNAEFFPDNVHELLPDISTNGMKG